MRKKKAKLKLKITRQPNEKKKEIENWSIVIDALLPERWGGWSSLQSDKVLLNRCLRCKQAIKP